MSTIPAKQVVRLLAAPIRISGFSANGASGAVTTPITTALSTAGNGSVSVPLQPSASNGLGVITSGANNRVEIYNATSKDKIASGGEEVYGRLTEAGGVYTLTYYTLSNAGVETAYSFGGATSIDFEFGYRFDFHRIPVDALISMSVRNISDDPANSGGGVFWFGERLTVTATNTISDLTKTPNATGNIQLIVNGVTYSTFGGGGAAFSLSGKVVTWSAANAGFSIETTDKVDAFYATLEA